MKETTSHVPDRSMDPEMRLRYTGHPQQLFSLRRVTVEEGPAKGGTVIEARTAAGLSVDILADHGLDIGQVLFRGVNMTFLTKNGCDGPAADIPYESEFLHYFPGGLLYTCGLRSAGPGCRDRDGEYHPFHGRYHGLAADHIAATIEGDEMVISGVMRETALFGAVLEVNRMIRIPCEGARITIEDTVTNLTPRDEEIMQIYHCNFGYPLLSEDAELILPEARETIPRTPWAAQGLDKACTFEKPIDGDEERVFFQKMKEDFTATLKNPALGMAMTLTWSGDTLPILAQWRSMASGDYALGLEPCNNYIMGRKEERENGTLPVLPAFRSIRNTLCFRFDTL